MKKSVRKLDYFETEEKKKQSIFRAVNLEKTLANQLKVPYSTLDRLTRLTLDITNSRYLKR